MKKLVPLCLATLAMTTAACSDDDGAVVPPDAPDGSVQTTETPASSSPADTSTSAPVASDAGGESSSAPSVTDAGGEDTAVDVDGGSEPDSGLSSGDVGDGGSTPQADAGDGGPTWSAECLSACTAAVAAGCEDNSLCEEELCELMYYYGPACIAEADAYLACIGETAAADEFECSADDRPQYVGVDCNDPFYGWLDCMSQ